MCATRLQIVLLISVAVSGCARLPVPAATQPPRPIHPYAHTGAWYPRAGTKTIYVVSNGWHTGVIVRSGDISPQVLPEIRDFPQTDFVEFGWGDEGFYRAQKITLRLVLQAALWPTPSVLHVAGFRGSVEHFHQASDVVEVELTHDQFQKMCQFLSDTFARNNAGEAIPLGPGIYGESTFYRAKGSYYATKTCNLWTAQALKQAGCRITPQFVLTAEDVLSRARKFDHVPQQTARDLRQVWLHRHR